jgi:AmiR/NasT family two-component response regulator
MPTRLLLAEDEPNIRLDLRASLEHLGYRVVAEVADGAGAIARSRALRPDPVIMCIRLPELDGITAAGILTREQLAPVQLVSATCDEELIARAGEAGVLMYVTKPWRESDMRPTIEIALARHGERLALKRQVHGLEEHLATRTVVERAAATLMYQQGLTEPEAFRRMCRLALNSRKSLREVADAILLAASLES